VTENDKNIDEQVVKDFGSEWSRFDQSKLSSSDHQKLFDNYFLLFPWADLPPGAVGADIGCGSGRWAVLAAPKVGHLHLVDPSAAALQVTRQNLAHQTNTSFHHASVDALPFEDDSLDFAYALGVLHHVPDTSRAIKSVARTLKPGAPFLVYLYYAFDHRPWWFVGIWQLSDLVRRVVSRLPDKAKNLACDAIALTIYWPLARAALLLDKLGILPASWPLSAYRDRDFYVLRTDALDRFGTRLEQRFSYSKIRKMLDAAGLVNIQFSNTQPFWCAVGFKGPAT
jgi:ubiquinone/menaquinone biosynthesis C-methylase UbiE